MHRTQIYLGESLHSNLKARARTEGVSLSEAIRRVLEKHVQSDPLSEAQAFFGRLQPLESLAEVSAQTYVRALRSQSRLLRDNGSGEPT
jgi:hypothetical protein